MFDITNLLNINFCNVLLNTLTVSIREKTKYVGAQEKHAEKDKFDRKKLKVSVKFIWCKIMFSVGPTVLSVNVLLL